MHQELDQLTSFFSPSRLRIPNVDEKAHKEKDKNES